MRMFPLLAATVVFGAAAACTQCSFTDTSGQALSTCSANDNHRLHCAGEDKISSGTVSFDNIACSGTEWYGLTCDGKVALLGASVNVSCPFNCGTACASVHTANPTAAPIGACFDNKEMKSCATGDMTIQTESGLATYSKAVCMGDNNWIALNCDGSIKKIAGALNATCAPALPCPTIPKTEASKLPGWCTTDASCADVESTTPTEIKCPATNPKLMLIPEVGLPWVVKSAECNGATGKWTLIDNQVGVVIPDVPSSVFCDKD